MQYSSTIPCMTEYTHMFIPLISQMTHFYQPPEASYSEEQNEKDFTSDALTKLL